MKKIYDIFCFVFFFACTLHAQTNIGFESTSPGTYSSANAVSGWTVSSKTVTSCNSSSPWTPGSPEFSIIATPQLSIPNIGTLPNSPLGGTVVAQLNSYSANNSVTKLTQTISVTSLNAYVQLAYAGIWQGGTHNCCEQSGLKILLYDQIGNPITCPSFTLAGAGCSSIPTHSLSGNVSWTNWQILSFVLSGYIGSVITMEIESYDCIYGDHYGTVFIDAKTNNCNCTYTSIYPTISNDFCTGSSLATLKAPVGYSLYLWTAPNSAPISPSQATLSSITLTNAVVGNIYTLTAYPPSAYPYCALSNTFALVHTSVSISGISSNSSCALGTSGSATILANGSSSGYYYTWINSTNSVVGTSSTVTNLAPGNYTINVSSSGSQSLSCGTATTTTTVGIRPSNIINLLRPFCGSAAYLSMSGGTNYQWYNGLSIISASLGGTTSSYTVNSPNNGAIYWLSYITSQGCQDSVKFILTSIQPGVLSILNTPTVCVGSNNATTVINMMPAPGAPNGLNSFYVNSVGTTPIYSSSVNPTSSTTFSVSNLHAGGTYSITSFDGICQYSTTFSVTALAFDYTLNTTPSPTVCSGVPINASINFDNQGTGQYTFSWSPTTFLANNLGVFQFTTITPTTTPNSTSTTIYSVTVTPTILNCPLTKTFSITAVDLLPPSISSVATLCDNSPNFTVQVNPPGGTFLSANSNFIGVTNGILTPSLATIGVNNFTYAIALGSCIAKTSSSFVVNTVPLSVSNSTAIFCGQTLTLTASGADSYLWNNSSVGSSIIITPSVTSSYSVIGTSTANSCSKDAQVNVIVTSSLVISIAGSASVCSGQAFQLTANGANTYTWSNNSSGMSTTVYPLTNTAYTVNGMDVFGCKASASKSIEVKMNPNIEVSGNFSICPGITTKLSAVGASSYSWSNTDSLPNIFVTPNTTTSYTVTGTSYFGCKNSKVVTVVVSGCVGIEKLLGNNDLTIYPNPSNSIFLIKGENILSLFVLDALGKIIVEEDFKKENYQLDLSDYPNGVYTLKVVHNQQIKTIKLIKAE